MTSKTFSTGTPLCPSPDIDGLSDLSLSDIDDTPVYPPPALYEALFFPPPALYEAHVFPPSALCGLPLWPQPDIPLWPSPKNDHTHLSPTLSATPIKYEGYLGTHLASPPTLDTQTLPQGLDENQEFVFNLGQGNVQPGMSLSEEERIRKLEKEIEEVQNLKTTMFNELEVRARKWAEVDKVKQRFEDMFAGFENKLVKIEAKMEEVREKSKASGRIEKKPKEKPKKTQNKLMYVDLTQTQEEFYYLDFT